jgi:hypothetical protein
MMIAKRFRLPALCLMALLTSPYGAAQQALSVGLPPEYNKWIDEDVRWIITPQERKELLKLTTDEQRDRFVIAFWERRNLNPGRWVSASLTKTLQIVVWLWPSLRSGELSGDG